MALSRNDKILTHLTRDMKIVKIGPSYSPVVRRSQGWNVFSLDHLDAEGLRKKYAHDRVRAHYACPRGSRLCGYDGIKRLSVNS